MKTKLFFIAAALAGLSLPLAAHAADEGFYLAADAGQAHYSGLTGQVQSFGGVSHTSDSDTGYRFTGGYQFNQYWGAEASYVDFGQGEANVTVTTPSAGTFSAKRKVHGFVFAGTGTYPFSDNWSGFLRFGGILGHVAIDGTGTGSLASSTDSPSSSDWKVTYGLGVNWKLTYNWVLRAGFDQYSSLGNQDKTGENDVNLLSVGVVYRF
ncbi:MAG: outer membrane beta-barrel protein [Bacillota bacterium]